MNEWINTTLSNMLFGIRELHRQSSNMTKWCCNGTRDITHNNNYPQNYTCSRKCVIYSTEDTHNLIVNRYNVANSVNNNCFRFKSAERSRRMRGDNFSDKEKGNVEPRRQVQERHGDTTLNDGDTQSEENWHRVRLAHLAPPLTGARRSQTLDECKNNFIRLQKTYSKELNWKQIPKKNLESWRICHWWKMEQI